MEISCLEIRDSMIKVTRPRYKTTTTNLKIVELFYFFDTHYLNCLHSHPSLFLFFGIMSGLKVVVGVKRVIDYAVKIAVKAEGVNLANVKMSMNPFWYVHRILILFI